MNELQLSKNVHFLGSISEERKLELYSESRLSVSPSVREGYGLSVIEANSVGTPVIGWDVPGLRDSIINDSTGLLVPFPDETALSERILALINDDVTWNRLSSNARKWALSHSWEDSARKFAEVIRQSLDTTSNEAVFPFFRKRRQFSKG
jgi:glycosyltransferase involved in cell wall biosynthesis